MFEILIITLVIAEIKGYKLKPLLKVWAVYPLIALAVFIFGTFIISFFDQNIYRFAPVAKALATLSMALPLMYLVYHNKTNLKLYSIFIALLGSGTILNKIVIKANGGKMPVFPTVSKLIKPMDITVINQNRGNMYIMGGSSTKLNFLSDIFDFGYECYSIGDLLMFAVPSILVWQIIKMVNEKQPV